MEKKRRLNKKKLIVFILMIFFCGLFIFSTVKIIGALLDNRENKTIKDIIDKSITINEDSSIKEADKYKVDFTTLKEKNSDTIAYLKVNNTNIDYVVVKGDDNSFYLDHNFNKKKNVAGWIFADYRNKLDGTDKNIVIYGHNTQNGSMFGTLKKAMDKGWQQNKDNQRIILITEEGTFFYQIFSTYRIEAEDYYIKTSFASDDEYQQFLDKIYYRSNYDYGVKVDKTETILTLSSCVTGGKKRVVVHAKKIIDEELNR